MSLLPYFMNIVSLTCLSQDVAQYTYPQDQVWALMDEVKDLKKNLTKNHKAAEMIKEYGHDYVGVIYSVGDIMRTTPNIEMVPCSG